MCSWICTGGALCKSTLAPTPTHEQVWKGSHPQNTHYLHSWIDHWQNIRSTKPVNLFFSTNLLQYLLHTSLEPRAGFTKVVGCKNQVKNNHQRCLQIHTFFSGIEMEFIKQTLSSNATDCKGVMWTCHLLQPLDLHANAVTTELYPPPWAPGKYKPTDWLQDPIWL